MKVVYIAGPFRAANAWDVERNVRRAEALALEVWRAGMVALCPHTNTRYFQGAADDEVWLAGDLELLSRCDAVLMVKGWALSSGARTEHEAALRAVMPVFETLDDLVAWATA